MTNTSAAQIKFLKARTSLQDVEDALSEMTDGNTEVVAMEVFDHPFASIDVDGSFGGEPGEKIGYIVMGRRDGIVEWLEGREYDDYSEIASRGRDVPVISEYEALEMFRSFIDEIYPAVQIMGCYYDASRLLEAADPMTFRSHFNDWADSEDFIAA